MYTWRIPSTLANFFPSLLDALRSNLIAGQTRKGYGLAVFFGAVEVGFDRDAHLPLDSTLDAAVLTEADASLCEDERGERFAAFVVGGATKGRAVLDRGPGTI